MVRDGILDFDLYGIARISLKRFTGKPYSFIVRKVLGSTRNRTLSFVLNTSAFTVSAVSAALKCSTKVSSKYHSALRCTYSLHTHDFASVLCGVPLLIGEAVRRKKELHLVDVRFVTGVTCHPIGGTMTVTTRKVFPRVMV